jgi:serine/threonine protein kinase
MATIIGKVLLDQFRVDSFLASGGMGAVYRVWDLKRNVPLAMKVLHDELAEDPAVFKRFQREANALKKLAHPNIVPFYGLYQTLDFAFLLERFIDGPSLKDILRQRQGKPLPVNDSLAYLRALSAALGYAHANGVIHCDVKPGNVLVDRGGSVYLADFGIARHAESTTTTMGTAGTPAYMAPEQIRGESVSPATDVYALGVVLFEMLTGQRPFRGTEAGTERGGATANERIRYGHLNLAPPDPRSFNPTLSAGLSEAVLKALEKQPQRRFQSTQELFGAVSAAAGQPGSGLIADRVVVPPAIERQENPASGAAPLPPKKRLPAYLAGGAVVMGLMAVIAVIIAAVMLGSHSGSIQTVQPKPNRPAPITAGVTRQTSTDITETPNREISQPGEPVTSTFTFTPSETFTPTFTLAPPVSQSYTRGEWIAYSLGIVSSSLNKYDRKVYVMNLQTREETQITFGGLYDDGPSFSPDGRSIVFMNCAVTGICKLVARDQNGAGPQLRDLNAKWPSWCKNPSKPWIIYEDKTDGHSNISMVNSDTNEVQHLTNSGSDKTPDWSPDCSRFVFLRRTTGSTDDIFLFDMNTRSEKQLTFTPDVDEWPARWSPDGEWLVYSRLSDTSGDGFFNTDNDVSDLMIIRADGSGMEALTNGKYRPYSPSFSPDGTRILFTDLIKKDVFQLVIYDRNQSSFEVITGNGAYHNPVWGP